MIKEIAWNTFKNTGNIDAFLEFKTIEDISEAILSEESSKLVTEVEYKENACVIEENISEVSSLENSQRLLLKEVKG